MVNWNQRFIELAKHYAQWSKDPSTKCGAVITKGKIQISQGYNGFPQHVNDSSLRLSNREIKYPMIIHAETNAILFAKRDLSGCAIYVWPMAPCARCAGLIIQSGIQTVYAPRATTGQVERWGDEMELAKEMYSESGVLFVEVGK